MTDKLMDQPSAVHEAMAPYRARMREHFICFGMDACNKVVYREVVSVGTLTASLVHPREVFSRAITRRVAGIIVSHNHPSGSPKPSRDDEETTRRLIRAGKILGIPVLDHVVVTKDGFYSFRDHGLMVI